MFFFIYVRKQEKTIIKFKTYKYIYFRDQYKYLSWIPIKYTSDWLNVVFSYASMGSNYLITEIFIFYIFNYRKIGNLYNCTV